MVRKGYASRGLDPEDGRAVRLEVTEQGLELHPKIENDLVEEVKGLIVGYDRDIRQATTRLIARLARAAVERFGRIRR